MTNETVEEQAERMLRAAEFKARYGADGELFRIKDSLYFCNGFGRGVNGGAGFVIRHDSGHQSHGLPILESRDLTREQALAWLCKALRQDRTISRKRLAAVAQAQKPDPEDIARRVERLWS